MNERVACVRTVCDACGRGLRCRRRVGCLRGHGAACSDRAPGRHGAGGGDRRARGARWHGRAGRRCRSCHWAARCRARDGSRAEAGEHDAQDNHDNQSDSDQGHGVQAIQGQGCQRRRHAPQDHRRQLDRSLLSAIPAGSSAPGFRTPLNLRLHAAGLSGFQPSSDDPHLYRSSLWKTSPRISRRLSHVVASTTESVGQVRCASRTSVVFLRNIRIKNTGKLTDLLSCFTLCLK